jgi:MFS transporter, FHS family, L-fucose permease
MLLALCSFIQQLPWKVISSFLMALYILTFGLAFLETTANPYILSMGSEETATQRLNLAQAFNPMGALAGLVCGQRNLSSTPSNQIILMMTGNLIYDHFG